MKIRAKLKEITQAKTTNEAVVAKFLLDYQGDYRRLKAQDIMEQCYVSLAAVTRLSKAVGLHGFNELKIYLYEESAKNELETQKYQGKDITDFQMNLINSLNATFSYIDEEMLNQVVDLIVTSEKINLHAFGGTSNVTNDFYQKLLRLNIFSSFLIDYHMQLVNVRNANKNTVSFGISYSGQTKEVLECLKIAKKNEAKTILLTANIDESYDFVDYVITIPESDSPFRNTSFASRINLLAVLDIIFIKILNTNYDYYTKILEATKHFN